MADSISPINKLQLMLYKLQSTYLFACQCRNISQNDDFNAFSAEPVKAKASGKDKRGKVAEKQRQRKANFTCQARQRLLKRLLLIYLSTSLIPYQPRRRLYLQILRKCLQDKKFCAKRALGRLFRTPLMNWSGTWTSRGLPTNPKTGSCTGSKFTKLRSLDSSITALRLEQKTSGLFDKAEAGNRTVAGRVSGSGFKVGKMEPLTPAPGEFLEGLFQDNMPMELTEADYLDSFLDLSNFLPGDAEEKGPDDDLVETFERDMMGKVDFSGILTSLKEEASVFTTTSAEVVSSSTPDQPRKRKLAESDLIVEPFLDNNIVINIMDEEQSPGSLTSDHDYIIKKPRLQLTSTEIESPFSVPVSSTSESQTTSKSKYRERRDKNNVASQRSRKIRKEKYIQMEQEADELEVKNNKMREKITELEKLAKFMKAELIKKMTTAKA